MNTSRVVIINYGLGNLSSVGNAFAALGVAHVIADTPDMLSSATHIVLPGVGSFKEGMNGLKRGGWIEPLREQVSQQKKPLLGICLGMQLLADKGFENGECVGLAFISGLVEKIPVMEHHLPSPHIGWNSVQIEPSKRIVHGLPTNPDFYFVHSYCMVPTDSSVIAGTTEYGVPMTVIVEKDNIFGTQFHPEKSAEAGLKILKNFSEIV